jgi:hypothetical protein
VQKWESFKVGKKEWPISAGHSERVLWGLLVYPLEDPFFLLMFPILAIAIAHLPAPHYGEKVNYE